MELQHFSHEHPLILGEVNDDGEPIVCNVCWENISGSAFSCKNCSFFLHKSCAEFPEEMKHPIHAHSLTLQRAVVRRCDVCRDSIRGFSYQCSPCDFDVDIRCSVRGQHFSSKHQLMILNEDEKNDVDERLSCDVCLQQIIGSTAAYKCTNCSPSIYFHKLCAQLPAEMEHPMHPEHPLALLPVVPNKFRCDGCYIDLKEFIYRCSICNFNLDRRCALRAQKVNHESHEHPLSLVSSSASFECHACGTKREGMSYMCDTCSFWIHMDCASLTPTFKHHTHVHPLTLIYPTHEHHYLFTQHMCRICEDSKEEGRFWLYVCIGCRYCIHVKCSTKTKERKSAIEVEIIDETNLIHLPMADDSVSAIDLFLKQISMGNNKRETELNHFSHHHPLILFGVQGDNNLCYENELLMLNELNKDKICNACVRKISAPFYSCGLCDFFLHKWCAELPNELEQPCLPNEWEQQCHKHQLALLKKPPEPRGLFYCNGCEYYCNGFAIRCIKNKCFRNGYNLDVKCASLPKAIIHKVHEHPLFLKNNCVRAGCAACPRVVWMFAFGCDICNFNLHYTCALLPDTIKHRYDEHHPFTLIYAPIKDGPDEYICEFCEEEIDPNFWFYHCIDCDQSACAKCICTERKEVQNIKWGSTYNFDSHPHCLIYVPVANESFNCAYCHKHINFLPFAERDIARKIGFKCEQCNIMLHPHCPHP
ncbi:hypothetical protein LOK49_LG02G01722 [Camellia lanceoleosa]|uniref:Uncharacterized protein n=1 Tax=Camellia lanceoleosa TaxID=1840588 RepID=A0ACC0IP57_9ERIC|nr:hypothetical protein LOK49_LG02G01722 [Camellia lanceoleosa]